METEHIPHLTPLKKTAGQTMNQILTNIVIMLSHRGLIDEKDIEKITDKITAKHTDDMMYMIDTKKGQYPVKFIPVVITTIKKPSVIVDFLTAHPKGGLIVVKEIKQNAHTKLYRLYPLFEIFSEDELMINLKYRIDAPSDYYKIIDSLDEDYEKKIEEFLKDYNSKTRKKLPVIKEFDPLAKYLFSRPGDVIKIIRHSSVSMKTPYYRFVVKSNLNVDTKEV
jgi:DNA-directed RNA polymerase subunit H (RpoH/RPB5)